MGHIPLILCLEFVTNFFNKNYIIVLAIYPSGRIGVAKKGGNEPLWVSERSDLYRVFIKGTFSEHYTYSDRF